MGRGCAVSPVFPVTSPRKTRPTYWYHWGMVSSSTYVFTANQLAFAATAGWAWQTNSHTIDSSTALPAGVPSGLSVLGNTTRAPLLMFQTL